MSSNNVQPSLPHVTILISIYNGERTLDTCMASIRAQTFGAYDIIAVDDASTDQTAQVLRKWQRKLGENKLIILTNSVNRGLTRSLNRALRTADTPLIARIDADDIWHPEKLALQIRYLQEHPEVGVVGTWYENKWGPRTRTFRLPERNTSLKAEIFRRNPFGHSCVVIRKHILDKAGGYDESVYFGQDRDLWFRLMPHTRFHNIPRVLVTRRDGGLSRTRTRQQMWQGIKTRVKYIRKYRASLIHYLFLIEPLSVIVASTLFWSSTAKQRLKQEIIRLLFINDRALTPHRAETIARLSMAHAFADSRDVTSMLMRTIKPWQVFFLRIPPATNTIYMRTGALASFAIAIRQPGCARNIIQEVHNFHFNRNLAVNTLYKIAFRRADLLVTTANETRTNWIRAGIKPEKILVVPSGVDKKAYDAITASRSDLRSQLNLPQKKTVILYAGNLYRHRGIEDIIACANRYLQDKQLLFVLVGGASQDIQYYQQRIQKRYGRLPNLFFAGFKHHDAIPGYLKAADILLATYSKKCATVDTMSPIKILEAMASGTPLVTANLPRIRTLVSHDTAHFYEPDNAASLTDAIQEILTHPQEAAARARRAYHTCSGYAWETRAKKIIESL